MPGWTLDIDGRQYSPAPDSWIEAGYDKTGSGPQLLAVSAAVERGHVIVRYAHPTGTKVGVRQFPGISGDSGGVVPRSLLVDAWPRSIAAARLEPEGDIRLEEREYLGDLWGDRVDDVLEDTPDVDLDDERLVADGGLDKLYYSACNNGRRALHVKEDCPDLEKANSVSDCPVTHPPRGTICDRCAPDLTLEDVQPQVATDGGTEIQTTRLDCPRCDDAVRARYLGTATTDEHDGHIVGWRCTECDAELQEHVDHRGNSFDLDIVDSSTGGERDAE